MAAPHGARRDEDLNTVVALQVLLGLVVITGRKNQAVPLDAEAAQVVAPVADQVRTVGPWVTMVRNSVLSRSSWITGSIALITGSHVQPGEGTTARAATSASG